MSVKYRALRSSVLRLRLAQGYVGDVHELADMIRFIEAIDQALVESITAYGKAVETIEVESTREQSTIFRVALPVG
jgi:hypothetical protein